MFVLLGHGYLFYYVPLGREMGMSFFAMPYIMHSPDEIGITPYTRLPDGGQVCTILKCPWTGPYIRALSKKRHTHAPKEQTIKTISL